jgi:hypothetical protein
MRVAQRKGPSVILLSGNIAPLRGSPLRGVFVFLPFYLYRKKSYFAVAARRIGSCAFIQSFGATRKRRAMTVIEEKMPVVPLCPVHPTTSMQPSEVLWRDPISYEGKVIFRFRCAVVGCHYVYSANGYSESREGEQLRINSAFRLLCPAHDSYLLLSHYDSQSKTGTWRCPHPGCETIKKSRLG